MRTPSSTSSSGTIWDNIAAAAMLEWVQYTLPLQPTDTEPTIGQKYTDLISIGVPHNEAMLILKG
jgi:hypothetical protein